MVVRCTVLNFEAGTARAKKCPGLAMNWMRVLADPALRRRTAGIGLWPQTRMREESASKAPALRAGGYREMVAADKANGPQRFGVEKPVLNRPK